ncbi:hypothetical protein ACIGO9_30835 [Nocardia asteroides]|uniref:hypothetical protein n=1 Tax=Nocardia asteroides TaxID=1824 RepID=UPI0037CAEE70
MRTSDPQAELDELIKQAVAEVGAQNREAIPEIVARLRAIAPHVPRALDTLLSAVASVPASGKAPVPLEIAPHLHQKLKAESHANKARGRVPTMTGIVLEAIGKAHDSDRLAQLVEAHKKGERHNVPLFGQLVAGTAPRGTTLRMQFGPDSTARFVAEVLAAWHQVGFVVLVRLAVADRYKRGSRGTAEVAGQRDLVDAED